VVIFFIITAVVLCALGAVIWMIWKESSSAEENGLHEKSSSVHEDISAAALLDKLGLEQIQKKNPSENAGLKRFLSKFPSLKKNHESPLAGSDGPSLDTPETALASGTAALRLDNVPSNQAIDAEIELSIKNEELEKERSALQEKYQKIESLLTEKTGELEKIQKELEHERQHRTEFNKVKDLLEKELKDAKDNAKQIETELRSVKGEHQVSNNRIIQLEEKIKNIEKASFEKEALINDLNQKLSAFEQANTTTPEPDSSSENQDIPAENPEQAIPAQSHGDPATLDVLPDNQPELPEEQEQMPIEEGGEAATEDQTPQANTNSDRNDEPPIAGGLNLKPVSSLENTYETDAAPIKPPSDEEKKPADSKQENLIVKEDNVSQLQETARQADIDAFLEEHLENNIDHEKIPDTQQQQQTSEPSPDNDVDTNTMPTEKDNTAPIDDPAPDQTPAEIPEKIDDQDLSAPDPDPRGQAKLAPDIFKDIEDQFRKIQEEMNTANKNENTETSDPEPPETNENEQPD